MPYIRTLTQKPTTEEACVKSGNLLKRHIALQSPYQDQTTPSTKCHRPLVPIQYAVSKNDAIAQWCAIDTVMLTVKAREGDVFVCFFSSCGPAPVLSISTSKNYEKHCQECESKLKCLRAGTETF